MKQPLFAELKQERPEFIHAKQFFQHLAHDEQDKAEALLQQDPELAQVLLQQDSGLAQALLKDNNIPFTDHSGRTFTCTAYEYAYWAKDTDVQRMLKKYTPQNEKTLRFILKRVRAIEALMSPPPATGLEYPRLEGFRYDNTTQNIEQQAIEHRVAHSDLTSLINALTHYVNEYLSRKIPDAALALMPNVKNPERFKTMPLIKGMNLDFARLQKYKNENKTTSPLLDFILKKQSVPSMQDLMDWYQNQVNTETSATKKQNLIKECMQHMKRFILIHPPSYEEVEAFLTDAASEAKSIGFVPKGCNLIQANFGVCNIIHEATLYAFSTTKDVAAGVQDWVPERKASAAGVEMVSFDIYQSRTFSRALHYSYAADSALQRLMSGTAVVPTEPPNKLVIEYLRAPRTLLRRLSPFAPKVGALLLQVRASLAAECYSVRFDLCKKISKEAQELFDRLKKTPIILNDSTTARAFHKFASVLARAGEIHDALLADKAALLCFQQFYYPVTDHTNIAATLSNSGLMYERCGDKVTGIKYKEQAHEMLVRIEKKQSNGILTTTLRIATSLNNLGRSYQEIGHLEEGIQYQEAALETAKRLAELEYVITSPYFQMVAQSLNNLGSILEPTPRRDEGIVLLRQAQELNELICQGKGQRPPYLSRALAMSHANLGSCLMDVKGCLEKSKEHLVKAIHMFKTHNEGQAEPVNISISENNLGIVIENLGDPAAGLEHKKIALAIRRELYKDIPAEPMAISLYCVGEGMMSLNAKNSQMYQEGMGFVKEAIRIFNNMQYKNLELILSVTTLLTQLDDPNDAQFLAFEYLPLFYHAIRSASSSIRIGLSRGFGHALRDFPVMGAKMTLQSAAAALAEKGEQQKLAVVQHQANAQENSQAPTEEAMREHNGNTARNRNNDDDDTSSNASTQCNTYQGASISCSMSAAQEIRDFYKRYNAKLIDTQNILLHKDQTTVQKKLSAGRHPNHLRMLNGTQEVSMGQRLAHYIGQIENTTQLIQFCKSISRQLADYIFWLASVMQAPAHLNINLDNIFLSKDGCLKVSLPTALTNQDQDALSNDVWAIGVIMYSIMKGINPQDKSPPDYQEIERFVIEATPKQWEDLFVDPFLVIVAQACLKINSKQRATSAELMAYMFLMGGIDQYDPSQNADSIIRRTPLTPIPATVSCDAWTTDLAHLMQVYEDAPEASERLPSDLLNRLPIVMAVEGKKGVHYGHWLFQEYKYFQKGIGCPLYAKSFAEGDKVESIRNALLSSDAIPNIVVILEAESAAHFRKRTLLACASPKAAQANEAFQKQRQDIDDQGYRVAEGRLSLAKHALAYAIKDRHCSSEITEVALTSMPNSPEQHVISKELHAKYQISKNIPENVDAKKNIILYSTKNDKRTPEDYFVVNRSFVLKHFAMITDMTSDQGEGDVIPPMSLEATYSTNTIIRLMEWCETYEQTSRQLPPVDLALIQCADYFNISPVLSAFHYKNAHTTFHQQAGQWLLTKTPEELNQLTQNNILRLAHFKNIVHSDDSLIAKFLKQFPQSSFVRDYLKDYYAKEVVISLQDARSIDLTLQKSPHITVKVDAAEIQAKVGDEFLCECKPGWEKLTQPSLRDGLARSRQKVQILKADDQAVNRFFKNHPNAVLMIDFGDATSIKYHFGYDHETTCSSIPVSIQHIVIHGDQLTEIEGRVLMYSPIISLKLPKRIRKIGDFFLCDSKITDILWPDSLVEAGSHLLEKCKNLTFCAFPNKLKTVGNRCLADSGVCSVTFSDELAEVGDEFLRNCKKLMIFLFSKGLVKAGTLCLSGCHGITSLSLSDEFMAENCFLYDCRGLREQSVSIKKDSKTYNFFFAQKNYQPRRHQVRMFNEELDYVRKLFKVIEPEKSEQPGATTPKEPETLRA